MRIAYLAPRIDVRSSSAEVVHVFEVAKAWQEMGHDVVIFTSRLGRPASPMAKKFQDFPVVESQNPMALPVADMAEISYCRSLFHESRKSHPDLLYLRHFASTLPAHLTSEFLEARLFVEVNGVHEIEEKFLTKRYMILRGVQRLDGIGFRSAERVVAVTPQIADYLVKTYGISPRSVSVIHNGANIDLFRPQSKEECRRNLGLPVGIPVVLFVGDLARWQGVDVLIRSAPTIIRALPSAVLAIVGGGAAINELKELARQLGVAANVRFVGPVAYESVPNFLGACDVAVAPRRHLLSSSSPLKLYEYMSCARPVIASRIPEFQVVEDQQAGLLVEPEEPELLAEAVVEVASNPGLSEEMGRRGREIAEKEYSWHSVAARIASFF